jgi:Malectin-like domain
LTVGLNYLIRATFYYANYDSLNKPPIFDIYLGVNFWDTVATSESYPEIIFTATADFVHVCLLNKDQGIPFISSIHLRQFKSGMYSYVNSTTPLILVSRNNFGGSNLVTR